MSLPGANFFRPFLQHLRLLEWQLSGRPAPPPPLYKHRTVHAYGRRYSLSCLIETGTYLGDMVAAQLRLFTRIFSIELDSQLAEAARMRFAAWPHVSILQGDSARVLPDLLRKIEGPCLFWLDGHFSGGTTARGDRTTPVLDELDAVLSHGVRGHVILIDDARLFDGTGEYPTLEDVERVLERYGEAGWSWRMETQGDIIRIHAETP